MVKTEQDDLMPFQTNTGRNGQSAAKLPFISEEEKVQRL
jgi:hypothetical protein